MTDKQLDDLVDKVITNFKNETIVNYVAFRDFINTQNINNVYTNVGRDLYYIVINRMRVFNYITFIEKNNSPASFSYIEFTDIGKKALVAGGHYKYLKLIKPNMTKFEKLSISIAIGAVIISFLTFYNDYKSKSKNEDLIKRIEKLEKKIKK